MNNLIVEFDYYGNLYLILNSDKIYQVNIDRDDNLYLDPGDYHELNYENDVNQTRYKKIDEVKGSLQEEIIKEIKENKTNQEYIDYLNYYAEDVDYLEGNINNNDDQEQEYLEYLEYLNYKKYKELGEFNKPFDFCYIDPDKKIPVRHRFNGDIAALYDVFIYQDGRLIFKTNSHFNDSI